MRDWPSIVMILTLLLFILSQFLNTLYKINIFNFLGTVTHKNFCLRRVTRNRINQSGGSKRENFCNHFLSTREVEIKKCLRGSDASHPTRNRIRQLGGSKIANFGQQYLSTWKTQFKKYSIEIEVYELTLLRWLMQIRNTPQKPKNYRNKNRKNLIEFYF